MVNLLSTNGLKKQHARLIFLSGKLLSQLTKKVCSSSQKRCCYKGVVAIFLHLD